MRAYLTDDAIRAHRYAGGTDYLWDRETPGLGIRTYPSGAKSWVVKLESGTIRVLGPWPDLAVQEAWLEARRLRHGQAITDAGLPQRPHLANEHTVAGLAAEHIAEIGKGPKRLAACTRYEYERVWRTMLLPAFGHLYLSQLSPRVIQEWVAENEHRPYQVNRALAILRAAYRLAEKWEWVLRGSNPVAYVDRYDEAPRDVIAQPKHELPEFWRWTDAAMRRPRDRRAAVVLQLVALTGCRPGEIKRLRLEEVDLSEGTLELAEHKSRRWTRSAKRVWLNPLAVAVLARHLAHERLSLRDEGPVFRAPLPVRRVWETGRDAIGAPHLQLRDLRRTFDTLLGEAGVDVGDVAAVQSRSVAISAKHYRKLRSHRLHQISDLGGALMRGGGAP